MARKRMVDPGIWQSEDFGHLTTLAKLVFIGLFSQADDEGRGRGNPQYIKNTLFPYDEEMGKSDIEKALAEIAKHMSILFYACDGSEFYSLTNWRIWQKVDRPQPSRLPPPSKGSAIYRESFDEQSSKSQETSGDSSLPTEQNKNETEENNTGSPAPPGGEAGEDPPEQTNAGSSRYTPPFEVFWLAYPRKDDKGQAYKKYQARLNDGYSEPELLAAAKAYSDKCKREKTEQKYIKQAKTFLGDATPFIEFIPKRPEPGSIPQEERDLFADTEREWEAARIKKDGDDVE